jgi:hypothetical protein
VHLYQCRWCGLFCLIGLLVTFIGFGDILFDPIGGFGAAKAIGLGIGSAIGLLWGTERLIFSRISHRLSRTRPRIKFCRKTNQVFVMNAKGEIAAIPWEEVTWIIGLSTSGPVDYQLFITRNETSRFYETAIAASPFGFNTQSRVRYVAAFHAFVCHYMRYGPEYISAFRKTTHFPPVSFWDQEQALGVVVLEPKPYPYFQPEWESDINRSLRFLARYLFFHFYPLSRHDELYNFKAFPREMERL